MAVVGLAEARVAVMTATIPSDAAMVFESLRMVFPPTGVNRARTPAGGE
jgi:hypothetical protein